MRSLDVLSGERSAAKIPLAGVSLAERFPRAKTLLTLHQIRNWFDILRRRKLLGENVPSFSEMATRAGLSRQTLYALLRDQRPEFGTTAQIRLSRVIQQISADPSYQKTRLMRLSLSQHGPRLHIGNL